MDHRRLLQNLRWQASRANRWRRMRAMAAAGRAPISILVCHRIADDAANAWTTPTRLFQQAIDWIKPRFDLISLAETRRRIAAGQNHRPAVAITFDDGYAINCEFALPLLIAERIPCTYFVCSEPALRQTPFAHDQQIGRPLPPNTLDQLRALADAGIEIGAHSRTHADFGRITSAAILRDELVTARDELAAAIGRPIRYFAFPFGCPQNLSAEAFCLARAAGFDAVLSAYGGYNMPPRDPFHLQRRSAEGSLVRLKNWLSFDPLHDRKIRRLVADEAWCGGPIRAAA